MRPVSRRPPVSLDTSVARTEGYTYAAKSVGFVPGSRTILCHAVPNLNAAIRNCLIALRRCSRFSTDRPARMRDWPADGVCAASAAGQLGRTFEGALEGGQTANYLLFLMQGSDFRAVDVGDWYNFKPSIRHKTLSLEEAEARMASRTRAAEGARREQLWDLSPTHAIHRIVQFAPNKPAALLTFGEVEGARLAKAAWAAANAWARRGCVYDCSLTSVEG
jgi:hypothetical protein